MTITLSIDGVGGTPADVAVKEPVRTNFKEVSQQATASGGFVTTYVDTTSPSSAPRTLVVRSNLDGSKVRHSSLTLNTWARSVDSGTGLVLLEPISFVLAVNHSAKIDIEAGDINDAIMNLYGFTFLTLTSKVPDTAQAAKLLFGITNILG